jgi:aspartokinase
MIFDRVAQAQVNVDTIIQNVVHGRAEMSFSVPAEDVAATMFRTLAELEINLEMISTSPIKISCMIGRDRIPEAVRALHEAFALEGEPQPAPTN